MKNECSIVRDLLPLYLEKMLSNETSTFVKAHLESCAECSAKFEEMKDETTAEVSDIQPEEKGTAALIAVKKKLHQKTTIAISITAIILISLVGIFSIFPIWRIFQIGPMTMGNYYTNAEIGMALSVGSTSDRREAQAVLRLADKAFNDVQHTEAENELEYGILARYATDTDSYGDTAFNEHSLELWSAHLGNEDGWIWVFYSSATFNHDGSTAHSSQDIPALWKVEKNDSGEWVVVQIREHP